MICKGRPARPTAQTIFIAERLDHASGQHFAVLNFQ